MKRIFLVALLLLIAGCTKPLMVRQGEDYIAIDHPFTDRGDAEALQRAQRICSETKQVVRKAERACSLETCTTNYHCEGRSSAK